MSLKRTKVLVTEKQFELLISSIEDVDARLREAQKWTENNGFELQALVASLKNQKLKQEAKETGKPVSRV